MSLLSADEGGASGTKEKNMDELYRAIGCIALLGGLFVMAIVSMGLAVLVMSMIFYLI